MRNIDKALVTIGIHPEWSISELANSLEMSRSGMERIVRTLQAAGRLRRIGSRKVGRWETVAMATPVGMPGPAIPEDGSWIPAVPQETEAKLEQVMEAVEATYQAYLAAWERQDPGAEQLRQRQKQLGAVASRLQAARLRQIGAGFGEQSAKFQTANAKLEQSVAQLQEAVRRTGRVVEVAAQIDQILELAVKAMK